MRVILLDDVRGIGKRGQVVDVKDGYGRNFLLPRKLAEEATEGRLHQLAQEADVRKARAAKVLAESRALAAKLETTVVRIPVKVGDTGRLFGAVTNGDVAKALNERGFQVDRRQLKMDAIKVLGTHPVEVHLHEGINATVSIEVVAE